MHPFLLLCSFASLFSLTLQSLLATHQLGAAGFTIDNLVLPIDNENNPEKSFETRIEAAGYTYLMHLKVSSISGNSKPIKALAVLDTGSDLIWLKNSSCINDEYCYCKDSVQCVSKSDKKWCCHFCTDLAKFPHPGKKTDNPPCEKDTCPYSIQYEDNSTTEGNLTRGKLSFQRSDNYSIWFGVPTKMTGHFENKSAGIIGLGQGKLSLLKQLSKSYAFKPAFSYCLPPKDSHGVLTIGNAVPVSDNLIKLLSPSDDEFTPLCTDRYCISLTGVSFNGNDHHVKVEGKNNHHVKVEGKNRAMLIDTGTTFTYLRTDLFKLFLDKVESVVGKDKAQSFSPYNHCFKKEDAVKLTSVSLQFEDKMWIKLKPVNFFNHHVADGIEYECLTVVDLNVSDYDAHPAPNLLGSLAQINFSVAICLVRDHGNVSFVEKDCTKPKVEEE